MSLNLVCVVSGIRKKDDSRVNISTSISDSSSGIGFFFDSSVDKFDVLVRYESSSGYDKGS